MNFPTEVNSVYKTIVVLGGVRGNIIDVVGLGKPEYKYKLKDSTEVDPTLQKYLIIAKTLDKMLLKCWLLNTLEYNSIIVPQSK